MAQTEMEKAASQHPSLRVGPAFREARVVVVMLHGKQRQASEMIDLARRLDLPDVSFVAPSAHGGAWYPGWFYDPIVRNQPALDRSLATVNGVVEEIRASRVMRRRIVLVGFSQGACLAAQYIFRNQVRWGGLAVFTGSLIGPPGTSWARQGDLERTPVLVGTFADDPWVSVESVKETARTFELLGADVDLRIYPGAEHVVSEDEATALRAMLAAV